MVLRDTKNWPLLVSLFLLLSAVVLLRLYQPRADASPFANRVTSHLHEMETEVEEYLESGDLLYHLSRGIPVRQSHDKIELFEAPYTITIFQDDSLIFWNNLNVGLDISSPKLLTLENTKQLLHLPNGTFYKKTYNISRLGEVIVYYPIREGYNLRTQYLKPLFTVDKDWGESWYAAVPADKIHVSEPGRGVGIYDREGEEVFSLIATQAVSPPWVPYVAILLYFFAFFIGIQWFTDVCKYVAQHRAPWMGVALMAITFYAVWILVQVLNQGNSFASIPMFHQKYNTNFLAQSVGALLVNATLFVWLAIFFFKEFRIKNLAEYSMSLRRNVSVFLYAVIITGILGITKVLKGLVLYTDIPFDFDRISELRFNSLVAIVSVLLLMLTLFLFTYRISLIIREFKLELPQRLTTLAISVILTFSLTFLLGLDYTTLILLLLFSIIYIISFDLYIESDTTNLLWIVAWLVIYSAFSSSFLYKYNQMKEWNQRIKYAAFLTDDRDEEIERLLGILDQEIRADGEVAQLITDTLDYKKIEDLLLRNHSIDLKFTRYEYQLHLFAKDSSSSEYRTYSPYSPSIDSMLLDKEDEQWNKLQFNPTLGGLGAYFLNIHYPQNMVGEDVLIVLEFRRDVKGQARVSTELFMSDEYQELQGLSEYDYALYKNDEVAFNPRGTFPKYVSDIKGLPKRGNFRFETKEGVSQLLYHARNGNIVLMDIKLPDFISKVRSLNSYLFTIMVIVLGVLMIVNGLLQFLPFRQRPVFATIPSLRNRIQVSVIAIIILSFLVIGITTIIFFEQKNDEYHDGRLERKAKSIRGDMAREIEQMRITKGDVNKLKSIVPAVSTIHRMDINVFDVTGHLLVTSGKDIYSKGLVSPMMNAAAYYELSALERKRVTMNDESEERIGLLKYEVQYESLIGVDDQVVGFVGMPYYSQQVDLDDDTSDFIGRLLNVYVILLVVSGAIAILVANSITRPLSQIGEKLKGVIVGKKNEPIEWNSKDELGVLISEYNNMIKKLDDSTRLLAQTERESAWREMAKQVAHEIKNPLTPMKLSIQYLLHAYHANPDNMEAMLKRVSNTLIEQIDNLSYIATEFSNFAKMPRAENEVFEMNNLVQSVFDLFSAEQKEIDMNIFLPDKNIPIFADKNQLMRVFNNLIKNAMQAISEDRRGDIKVYLREIEGNKVQLEVKDNGSGIPEDMWEYIFAPHITTKSEGTGLGLAISKSIIEALDGRIYFHTVEHVGTSFFVELPIYKDGSRSVPTLD